MSFYELLLLAIALYYVIYLGLWIFLDCNVALKFNELTGMPTTVMRHKIVWITGASSGIGRALALQLAREGSKMILSARRVPELEKVKEECLIESAGVLQQDDVLVLPMDMLKIEEHEKCFNKIIDVFGRLDILVNNAGRSQRANWEDIDIKVDRSLFELDVFSVTNLTRIVVRYFLQRKHNVRGHIAVTSSIAGLGVVPFSATYCAAKHALNAYMNTLRMERRNIDVTIFAPGPIATDFLQEAFTAQPDEKYGQSTVNQKRMTAKRCGKLFAVAIANKMDLAWCGLFPVNFLAYVSRYPFLSKIAFLLLTDKTLNKIREGKL